MNTKPDFCLLAALARDTMKYCNWDQYTTAAAILDEWPDDNDEQQKAQLINNVRNFNACPGIVFW